MVIMGRDSTGQTQKIGEITRRDGNAIFDIPDNLKKALQQFRFEGKVYTPKSSGFFDILPYFLRGGRLWAVPEDATSKALKDLLGG